jgi:hypothetical protein
VHIPGIKDDDGGMMLAAKIRKSTWERGDRKESGVTQAGVTCWLPGISRVSGRRLGGLLTGKKKDERHAACSFSPMRRVDQTHLMALNLARPNVDSVAGSTSSSRTRGTSAYSLIETILAVGILGFLVTSLYTTFWFGFNVIKLSQEDVVANQVLVQKMELLRVYDWPTVTGGSTMPTSFTNTFPGSASAPGAQYIGTITVARAPLTESYSNSLRQVTVSMSWESSGIIRTRDMTTLVAINGIQTYKH